jgi:O-antigen biosynthesis protein WbqP
MMKRTFDLVLASAASLALSVPLLIIGVMVKLTSKGPALYWSDRVGPGNGIFRMPKFRTLITGTPAVATHLLRNPEAFLTPNLILHQLCAII